LPYKVLMCVALIKRILTNFIDNQTDAMSYQFAVHTSINFFLIKTIVCMYAVVARLMPIAQQICHCASNNSRPPFFHCSDTDKLVEQASCAELGPVIKDLLHHIRMKK
ncbi:hypothetical protein ABUK00_29060, partial [Raoultella planticola]|uniref:hypothetical protein n=1 Tax=Raoultella planticola TaxID=575 RepID=UPI002AB4F450